MKQCTYCKTENEDQAIQCANCGLLLAGNEANTAPQETTQEQKEQQAPAAKPKKKTFLAVIVGAAAVIVVMIVAAVMMLLQDGGQNDGFYYPEQEITLINGNGRNTVAFSGTKQLYEVPDVSLHTTTYSKLKNAALLSTLHNDVYLADETGLTELPSIGLYNPPDLDVLDYFSLSASGTAVAYYNPQTGKLYFQPVPIESDPVVIALESAPDEDLPWFRLSAKGNSIAYCNYENGVNVTYLYQDGQHNRIGENLQLFAFSDAAEYFFCYDMETYDLYVADLQGRMEKIAESIALYPSFANVDCSQFMFMDEGEWYVVENGSTVTKMTGFPDPEEMDYYINTLVTPKFAIECSIGYCYVDDLCGNYYTTLDGLLFYLDENWNWTLICEEMEDCARGQGKDVIYYMEDYLHPVTGAHTRLCRLNGGNPEDIEVVNDYIWNFTVSKDGKTVYYIDMDDCLWSIKGTGSPKLIAENVTTMQVTHDDYLMFVVQEDNGSYYTYDLYGAKHGKNATLIAENLPDIGLIATNTATYYTRDIDEFYSMALYGTEQGTDFTFLIEPISAILR